MEDRTTFIHLLRTFAILVGIFLITVVIRFPNLNRPLSKHHEFVTAISLRVLQIWDTEGASTYNYSPVMNYPGEANKFINNHASETGRMLDEKGNYYYISHPPFAYILPYFALKLVNVRSTVLSLQIFHLFINFLTGIFVYLIAKLLLGKTARYKIDRNACMAYLIYMFSTAVLWFQSNTYMSDMLVHFFFIVGIYLALKWKETEKSKMFAILFTINLFLMVYTSWLGVFFGFTLFLYGLLRLKSNKRILWMLANLIPVMTALLLVYFQYSSINGKQALFDQLFQRYQVRGLSFDESQGSWITKKGLEVFTLFYNYAANYLPILLVIASIWILNRRRGLKNQFDSLKQTGFICFAVLPIVLLHIALLNYSGHDFTVLYASCFLSMASVYLIKSFKVKFQNILVVTALLIFTALYYFINRPGEISLSGERYDKSMMMGEFIKEFSNPDEVVFLVTKSLDPMLVVYAERNIVEVSSKTEVDEKLKELGQKNAQVFME